MKGGADVPVAKEVLERRFGLIENRDFRIHPHRGKGQLPADPYRRPELRHQGLLDQLPAKLRGYAQSHSHFPSSVVVLVDADDDDCVALKASLVSLWQSLEPRPPVVLFRIAVQETESWFLADPTAIKTAYPRARLSRVPAGFRTVLRRTTIELPVAQWEPATARS